MENSGKEIKVPTYSTDKRQLLQITERIVDGKKVIKQKSLRAYQTIHRATNSGTA